MGVELLTERMAGETELLRENQPQNSFVHHKSLMAWLELVSRTPTNNTVLAYDNITSR
jgi:hypothetical protein